MIDEVQNKALKFVDETLDVYRQPGKYNIELLNNKYYDTGNIKNRDSITTFAIQNCGLPESKLETVSYDEGVELIHQSIDDYFGGKITMELFSGTEQSLISILSQTFDDRLIPDVYVNIIRRGIYKKEYKFYALETEND